MSPLNQCSYCTLVHFKSNRQYLYNIVTKWLCPWSKGCLFVCSFINEYTMNFKNKSKFSNLQCNFFASSNLFHIVIFWYNQLNFLKFSLSICFGFKIRLFIGGLIYASNFIQNTVHSFIVICVKFTWILIAWF